MKKLVEDMETFDFIKYCCEKKFVKESTTEEAIEENEKEKFLENLGSFDRKMTCSKNELEEFSKIAELQKVIELLEKNISQPKEFIKYFDKWELNIYEGEFQLQYSDDILLTYKSNDDFGSIEVYKYGNEGFTHIQSIEIKSPEIFKLIRQKDLENLSN